MSDRYWIGYGGNWVDTAHWSLESGGSGGASMPGAGDKAIFDVNSMLGAGQTVAITGVPVSFQELLVSGVPWGIIFDGYMGFEGGGYIQVEAGHILCDLEILSSSYGLSLLSPFRWFGISGGASQLNENIYAEGGNIQVASGELDLNYRDVQCSGMEFGSAGILTKAGAGSGDITILPGGSFQADPDATISGNVYIRVYGDFYGGGHTYKGVDVYTTAGETRAFEGSNTFSWLGLGIETAGDGQGTIEIEPGSTQTIIDDWAYFGGNYDRGFSSGECRLTSSEPWLIDITGATGVCESYDCTYVNCELVGTGAQFHAFGYNGNVDGGGNVGIDFAAGTIPQAQIQIVPQEVHVSINPTNVGTSVTITPQALGLALPVIEVTALIIAISPLAPSVAVGPSHIPLINIEITVNAPIPADCIVGNVRVRINVRHPSVIWQIPRTLAAGAAIIYQCVLTSPDGLPDLVLPMASFQARLRDSEPSYLSCVIPNSAFYADEIIARASGQLIIRQGVRLVDGREMLQEMIRVDYESLAIDRGANSDSATLVGHRTTTSSTPAERTMQKVSYFALEAAGKRRIRCAIDLFLRPGDVCMYGPDGMDWFMVGQISYVVSASPATAIMEVSEA